MSILLGHMFKKTENGIRLLIPRFENEQILVNVISYMFSMEGYHVVREVVRGNYRFDLIASKGEETILVEAKAPKHSSNRIAGKALNQLISYLSIYPVARGLLILSRPVTSHILKYMVVLREKQYYRGKQRIRVGVGFPITDGKTLCLWTAENTTTWSNGVCLLEAPLIVMYSEGITLKETTLSKKQFFDYIVYSLWIQNIHEMKKIGLDEKLINIIIEEAQERGYTITESGSIKEPWAIH